MKETLKALVKVTPNRVCVQKHYWKTYGVSAFVIGLIYAAITWVFTPAD